MKWHRGSFKQPSYQRESTICHLSNLENANHALPELTMLVAPLHTVVCVDYSVTDLKKPFQRHTMPTFIELC